ncbi:MAG: permease [Treponema sp.]|nr:permease [Treponema sp.]
MIEMLGRELTYFWYYFLIQTEQIVWYYLFGMALGSLISVFGKEKIHTLFIKMRNTKMGMFGIIPASLLGIASPLCMYGTIPIAASFREKGVAQEWIAAFIMSSILLNPQLLFYSAALGYKAVIIRFTVCFILGITAGLCIRLLFKNKQFFKFTKFENMANRDTEPNPFIRYIKNFGRNIKATWLYFLIGIILSALFQRYAPQEFFAKIFINNKGFGILMAAAVGVPLYACGGGTIPLLQTWLQRGMTLGSASAFMITGQAMKITNLGAVKIVLGIKHFVFFLLFVSLFAVLSGLAIDFMFRTG